MVGAPIAAIGGAKRGIARAKHEALIKQREQLCSLRRETAARYAKEGKVVSDLMDRYDTNKSGALEQEQVAEMLGDYTLNLKGHHEKPTKLEVDCLLNLVDKSGDGKVAREEVLSALSTWFAYIEKSDETAALLQKHDLSRTGKINHGELRPLLVELNEGRDIPDDVLQWVWQQADLTGDGSLGQFELTRAIAAWYVWMPEEEADGALTAKIDHASMPERPSTCCAVS